MRFGQKFICILFFLIPFSFLGQKLQLQKNLESVSKVLQSPKGTYLLASELSTFTLIDQKSKIQVASMEVDFSNNGSIGQGSFLFYDDSRFIVNTARELLLVDLLNKKVDTLETKIEFPEIIESFIVLPNNPNKILITSKVFPMDKNGVIQLVNEKKGQVFYEDIKNCKIRIYDLIEKEVTDSLDFSFSVTTLATNESNEVLAGTFDGNIIKIKEDLHYEVLFKAFDRPVFSIVNKKNIFLVIPHRGKNLIFDSGEGDLYFFDKSYNFTKKITLPVHKEKLLKEDNNKVGNIEGSPNNHVLNVLNPEKDIFVFLNYGFNGLSKVNLLNATFSDLSVSERSASFYALNFDNSQIIVSVSNNRSPFGNSGKLYLYDLQSEKFIDVFRTINSQTKYGRINKVFYNSNYYYIAKKLNEDEFTVYSSNSKEPFTLNGTNILYNYKDNSLFLKDYNRLVYGTLQLSNLSKSNYNFTFKRNTWNTEENKDSLHLEIFKPIIDIKNLDSIGLPYNIKLCQKVGDDSYFIAGNQYVKDKTAYTYLVINSKGKILFELQNYLNYETNEGVKISTSGNYFAINGEKNSTSILEVWDWKNNKVVFSKKYKNNNLSHYTFDQTTDTFWFSEYDENMFVDIFSLDLETLNNQPKKEFSKYNLIDNFLPDRTNDIIAFGNFGPLYLIQLSNKSILWSSIDAFKSSYSLNIQSLPNGFGFNSEQSFISVDKNFKSLYFTTYDGNVSVESNEELFYKADKGAINNFGFVINGKGYLPSDYDQYFNRPDIVIKESGSTNETYQKLIEKAVLKRTKSLNKSSLNDIFKNAPLLEITNNNEIRAFTTNNFQTFDVVFTPFENRFIKSYSFSVNGVQVIHNEFLNNENKVSQNIELSQGKNLIQMNCIDNEGYISNTETYTIYADYEESNPKVYLIIIAADTYNNPDFNLKYSVKDANDLVTNLKKRYGNDLIVSTLINKNADDVIINQLKNSVKNANVNDKIIVFVSGHGVLDADYNFRFATPNMDFSKPNEFGITNNTLESILLASPARNKLLMIDACHSGELDKEEYSNAISSDAVVVSYSGSKGSVGTSTKTTTENSFELMRQLFNDVSEKSGIKVISAAAGNSYALESEKWKNGVFTYSLLNILEKNKSISISKLNDEVSKSVIKLTNSKQKPTNRGNTVEFDFSL